MGGDLSLEKLAWMRPLGNAAGRHIVPAASLAPCHKGKVRGMQGKAESRTGLIAGVRAACPEMVIQGH
ncbi:hypothetical protein [Cupriavidus taiwanensis]|uniref:hypothetical protein n=1 Tax=Cupriavidus taiwanensis TaxID=164546 RepID=UPI0011C0774A|nr:hypothetical protein [Cupriavidus taiwanensis]